MKSVRRMLLASGDRRVHFGYENYVNLPRQRRPMNATFRTVEKIYDVAARALESLLSPTLSPEQITGRPERPCRREAEAEHRIDFSSYTAEMAQQRQQQENDREAERRRHRDRGGRER